MIQARRPDAPLFLYTHDASQHKRACRIDTRQNRRAPVRLYFILFTAAKRESMQLKQLLVATKPYRMVALVVVCASVAGAWLGPGLLFGAQVAVARALAMNPSLLLADEATGNLDSKSADAVFELLRKVNREHGTAILFVTHNATLAARCDKIIRVVDGLLIDQDTAGRG
jgi:ABC-type transporter Mla maintaining outer membrane lipid asymmetry ATPase subunit MlaF